MAVEEIIAMRSIFCQPGEFSVLQNGVDGSQQSIVTVRISRPDFIPAPSTLAIDSITLTVAMSPDYPHVAPTVSVSGNLLHRRVAEQLSVALADETKQLIGQPMILDLVGWVRDNWPDHSETVECSAESYAAGHLDPDQCRTVILHFDHMRSRASYSKTIENWTTELRIAGRLMFCDRLITGLMQGTASDIKTCLQRLRTVNVDVDSHGRSCRERMMSVLCNVSVIPYCFTDFAVVELKSSEELGRIFSQHSALEELHDLHIKPLTDKTPARHLAA